MTLLTFQASRMETADSTRRTLEERIRNLRTISMILDSMQVKREILKVAPLEVGRGGLRAGGPGVLMMFDLNFLIYLAKQKEVFFRQSCINFHI